MLDAIPLDPFRIEQVIVARTASAVCAFFFVDLISICPPHPVSVRVIELGCAAAAKRDQDRFRSFCFAHHGASISSGMMIPTCLATDSVILSIVLELR